MIWAIVLTMSTVSSVHGLTHPRCHISGTRHVVADCKSSSIEKLPIVVPTAVEKLILSRNKIVFIPADAFAEYPNITFLDVSENRLYGIDRFALRGLFRLRVLNLNGNFFLMDYYSFPRGVFADCASSIRVLLLHSVLPSSQHKVYPTDSFAPLKQLRYLLLNPVDNFTVSTGFTALSSLRVLEFHGRSLSKLTRASVDVVRRMNVTSLAFRGVNLTSFEPDTFSDFPRLRAINLACNYDLGHNVAIQLLGKTTGSNIKTVILDRVTNRPSSLNTDVFCDTAFWRGVRRISVRANKIHYISSWVYCNSQLRYLSVAYNYIQFFYLHYPDRTKVAHIETLDMSFHTQSAGSDFDSEVCRDTQPVNLYCPSGYFRNEHDVIQQEYTNDIIQSVNVNDDIKHVENDDDDDEDYSFMFYTKMLQNSIQTWTMYASSLKHLYITHWLDMFRIDILGNVTVNVAFHNLVYLNISYSVSSKHIGFIAKGMNNLRVFDCSHGGIEYIRPDLFEYTAEIRSLNISHHALGLHTNVRRLLRPLRHLSELDLSNNQMQSIDGATFARCLRLRRLLLAENGLTSITLQLSGLSRLELLDLHGNHLTEIEADFRHDLDRLARDSDRPLSLDLRNNSLACGCDNVEFIRWIQTTSVDIISRDSLSCHLANGSSVSIASLLDDDPRLQCVGDRSAAAIIVPSCVCAVLVLTVTALVRYHRWYIVYHVKLFKARRQRRRGGQSGAEEPLALDAMVVYFLYPVHAGQWDMCSTVRQWVSNRLRPTAESDWGAKLYIGERDDVPGATQTDNFLCGISVSRKLIICLTTALLQDPLLSNSFNMALAARRIPLSDYIFVNFDDDAVSATHEQLAGSSLRQLLAVDSPAVHLDWAAVDGCPEAELKFWRHLRRALLGDQRQRRCAMTVF